MCTIHTGCVDIVDIQWKFTLILSHTVSSTLIQGNLFFYVINEFKWVQVKRHFTFYFRFIIAVNWMKVWRIFMNPRVWLYYVSWTLIYQRHHDKILPFKSVCLGELDFVRLCYGKWIIGLISTGRTWNFKKKIIFYQLISSDISQLSSYNFSCLYNRSTDSCSSGMVLNKFHQLWAKMHFSWEKSLVHFPFVSKRRETHFECC